MEIPIRKTSFVGRKNSKCVLFFVRAPEPGKVKTRLARAIGNDAALKLYVSFVADELEMLRNMPADVIICYYPRTSEQRMRIWLKNESYFMAQEGADLGIRMAVAFEKGFLDGYQKALLIGSDIPDLPSWLIVEAFDSLGTYDTCIGPSQDGGYYLIGFRKDTYYRDIFEDIPWGTTRVFGKTLQSLKRKGLNCNFLSRWKDIDELEDLRCLKRSLENNITVANHTLQCLKNLEQAGF